MLSKIKTPRFIFFFIAFLFFLSVEAQNQSRKFISAEKIDKSMKVTTTDGVIFFSAFTRNSMSVEFVRKGITNPPSFSIDPSLVKGDIGLMENADFVVYSTGSLTARVQKSPFMVSYSFNNKFLFSEEKGFFSNDSAIGFRFNLNETEKLMGGGERVIGMDRRGKRLELYNKASYGYEAKANQMYYSMPIAISSEKYMLIFDNGATGHLDLGASEKNILEFDAIGGRTSYLVVASTDWLSLATNFTQLVGHQPMPPRWLLGNISSRMGYHSQKQVEDVVDLYKANKIPLDGIVIDLFWFGKTLKGTMGNLDWYRDSFPQPEQMMAKNLENGVKTILITEPFILSNSAKFSECKNNNYLCTNDSGKPYLFNFYFGNTGLLDIFKPQTKDWFWGIYNRYSKSGVSGWWGDLGEPEVHPNDINHVNGKGNLVHNQYGHEWAKTVYEGYAKDFPNVRPVILMRAGFVGSQRYGLTPWSGDVSRTWGGLKPQVEIALQMGMQGAGYMSSDLGGFAGDYKDSELYTRWLQYGVFQPIYRTHGQEEVPAEPVYWDKETKDLVRTAIELRYALMPYNYTLAYENATLGLPMMRPLFYYDSNASLLDNKTEYMWGANLLIAPVTDKGIRVTNVYLPAGSIWFDFYNKAKYEGGREVTIPLSIMNIPVFVKAGSFITMVPVFQSLKDYSTKNLQIHYYFDESVTNSSGYMYDDDGVSKNAIEGNKFDLINFASANDNGLLTISITPSVNEYEGKLVSRNIDLIVYKLAFKPSKVTIGLNKVKVQTIEQNSDATTQGAFWNLKDNTLLIKNELSKEAISIIIKKSL